nr:unnamed protein product [Callosobruchus chinensis]
MRTSQDIEAAILVALVILNASLAERSHHQQTAVAVAHLQTQPRHQHQHRTKQAEAEKAHELWCYRCDTNGDGERCLDLAGNQTHLHHKCTKEQRKCLVRRISMSTSTDEITGKPKLWLLQRNCSEACEPGCIVIGERTKLHSCITCCDEHNFCNMGSGAARPMSVLWPVKNIVRTLQYLSYLYRG